MKTFKPGDVFDTSAMRSREGSAALERHGIPWDAKEVQQLIGLYHSGANLGEMAKELRRKPSAVITILENRGYVTRTPNTDRYITLSRTYTYLKAQNLSAVVNDACQTKDETDTTNTEKEITMTNIETKIFIRGNDASTMTDMEIFKLIAKLEGEAAALRLIKVTSSKIEKAIQALWEDVVKLANYVDSRE